MSSAGQTFLEYPVAILSPLFLPKSKGSIQYDCTIINFRRLMKLHPTSQLQKYSSRDILHSIAGLYDVALPCMDLNTIYASILDCKAVSIFVIDQPRYVHNRLLHKLRKKRLKKNNRANKYDELIAKKLSELQTNEPDTFCEKSSEKKSKTTFNYIFSDSESESDQNENNSGEDNDDSSGSDYETYTQGYNTFLMSSLKRKKLQQEEFASEKSVNLEHIGFEELLLGATTYEICHLEGKRILHLTFIAVQKYFRGSGLGTALLNAIKNRDISGDYQAIVVHADPGAVEFFKRNGFTDDYVTNSQWTSFAAEYTNCTIMTFYPSFSDPDYMLVDKSGEKGVRLMEKFQESWEKQSASVHCNQASLFHRMRQEIIELRKSLTSQDAISKQLMTELRTVSLERDKIRNQVLQNSSHCKSAQKEVSQKTLKLACTAKSPGEVSQIERELGPGGDLNDRDLIHQIKFNFEKLNLQTKVTQITLSFLSSICKDRFEQFQRKVPSSPPVQLYFMNNCTEQPLDAKRYCEILAHGFSDCDCVEYLKSKGLRFSTLASMSTHKGAKCTMGKVLLVDVILGTSFVESATKENTFNEIKYNSIILSSTLSSSNNFDPVRSQYFVKSMDQALPVALIEYIVLV